MPKPADALPGRTEPMPGLTTHYVNGRPLLPPYPDGLEVADFAFGCFWGAEKNFWETPGVWVTAVGYAGGYTPNPTYREACTGKTGHAETVRVVFDPKLVSYEQLLKVFWEHHDPTQGMRQGNDIGTQYRSAIFTHSDRQRETAEAAIRELNAAGIWDKPIVTEVRPAAPFYPAEEYHRQYFVRNPGQAYCAYVVAPKVRKFREKFAAKLRHNLPGA